MAKLDITKNKMIISEYFGTRKGYIPRKSVPYQKPRRCDGLIFILEGTCRYGFDDGTKFSVKKDDILYLAANSVYEMDVNCDRYEFFVADFNFSIPELRQSAVYTPLSPVAAKQLFSRVCYSRDADSPASFARDVGLVYQIVENITDSSERVYLGSISRAKIDRCADFIHLHFADESLSVSSLAESVSLSEVHFRKLFSGRFGLSPARYIMQTRVEHAIKLMQLDGISLEEIAEESGFSSLPYFNKVFKAFVGYTPAAYRHQLSKRADLT